MAHTLKLDIYCFSIREKRAPESDIIVFGDFFRTNFTDKEINPLLATKANLIAKFISEFTNSFKEKFVLNKDETKGIATDFMNPFPFDNIIDGMINGGLTGIDQNVYDRDNPKEREDKIAKNKITALPYYFKIWTPFDGSIGVLMIQSYTDMGVNTLMLDQIKLFFGEKGYSIDKYKHVPEEYKESFKKSSKIYKVTFLKSRLSEDARKGFNPVFAEKEGLKVRIEITGFEESPERFWKIFSNKKFIQSDLTALEMVNDDDYETIASYKDEYGHQSSAKVSKSLDILPTYFLSDDLKVDGSQYPDYDKIKRHTDLILSTVKKEIGYSPEDVE